MRTVLFLCTGNTCRSPMAQVLAEQAFRKAGTDLHAESAGLAALPGDPASQNAVEVMKNRGLDLSQHRSRRVSEYLLEQADRVFTMSEETAEWLKARLPAYAEKISPLPGAPIDDPYGGDLSRYEECAKQLERSIALLMEELA